jgi:DNA-binding CsgD family transcriptional regulator/tetratricopeptide (TPR) repeat protein
VFGEPGIGKTRLLAELKPDATRLGLNWVGGRAVAEQADVPLRVWSDALLSATRGIAVTDVPQIASYQQALGSVLPHWRPPGWTPQAEPPVVLAEGVLRVLAHLAGDAGLVLALEDLHWADSQSLDVLDYLVDHVAEVPVFACVTARPELAGSAVSARLDRAPVEVITLSRLSDADVRRMAAACGRTDRLGDLGTAYGLPLLVEDLLGGDDPRRGTRFADLVRQRSAQLAPPELAALSVAALLGERCEWAVVSDAAELTDESATLRALVAADLVSIERDTVVFRHALTRDVVRDQLLPAQRARFAAAAARGLLHREPATVERSLHAADLLAVANRTPQAVDLLDDCVTACLAAGDLPNALVAAQRARGLSDGLAPRIQVATGVRLASIELDSGDADAAAAHCAALLARSDGADAATTLGLSVLLARAHAAAGRWSDAVRVAEQARTLQPPPPLQAELALVDLRCALGSADASQRAAVEHLAAKSVALARAADDAALECAALMLSARVARTHDLDLAATMLGEALVAAERARSGLVRLEAVNELGTVEMLRDASVDRLVRAVDEAHRAGAFGAAASAGLNLASAHAMTGSHERCREVAVAVEQDAERLGLTPIQAGCAFMRGVADAFDGRGRRAETHLARALQLAPADTDLASGVWAIGRGIGALVEEDRGRAERAFETALTLAGPTQLTSILNAALGPRLLLAALAGQVGAGEVRDAAAGQPHGARWNGLWVGAALAVGYARAGEPGEAERHLGAALTAGERYPLFSTLVRRLVAECAIAVGFTDPAILLREAERGYASLDLAAGGTAVRALLSSIGEAAPRRRRGDAEVGDELTRHGVTAREAEVLALLADRLTNREIADRLFLSPKTVEKHVASLAVKLSAADRHALAEYARYRR